MWQLVPLLDHCTLYTTRPLLDHCTAIVFVVFHVFLVPIISSHDKLWGLARRVFTLLLLLSIILDQVSAITADLNLDLNLMCKVKSLTLLFCFWIKIQEIQLNLMCIKVTYFILLFYPVLDPNLRNITQPDVLSCFVNHFIGTFGIVNCKIS